MPPSEQGYSGARVYILQVPTQTTPFPHSFSSDKQMLLIHPESPDISRIFWKEVLGLRQVFLNQILLANDFTVMLTPPGKETANDQTRRSTIYITDHGFIDHSAQLTSVEKHLQSKNWFL